MCSRYREVAGRAPLPWRSTPPAPPERPAVTECAASRMLSSRLASPVVSHRRRSRWEVEGCPSPAQGEQVTFESWKLVHPLPCAEKLWVQRAISTLFTG